MDSLTVEEQQQYESLLKKINENKKYIRTVPNKNQKIRYALQKIEDDGTITEIGKYKNYEDMTTVLNASLQTIKTLIAPGLSKRKYKNYKIIKL